MYAISSFPLLVLFLASFVTGRARLQCFPTSIIILCAQFTNKFSYDSDELDAGRTLNAANTVNGTSMTIEFCIQFCDTGGFIYAGTEFGVSAHPLLPPPPSSILSYTFVHRYALYVIDSSSWLSPTLLITDWFSLIRTNVVRISFRFDSLLQSPKRLIILPFLPFLSTCLLSFSFDPLVSYSLFAFGFATITFCLLIMRSCFSGRFDGSDWTCLGFSPNMTHLFVF